MRLLQKIALAIILVIIGLGATSTDAHPTVPISRIPDDEFIKILAPRELKDDTAIIHIAAKSSGRRAAIRIPDSHVIVVSVVAKVKPAPTLKSLTSGVASYYCLIGQSRCSVGHSGGLYAAIRRDLLYLRGKTVQVCRVSTKACISVKIIDCNCGPNANLIDLYSDAFKKLAPISLGIMKVTVKW